MVAFTVPALFFALSAAVQLVLGFTVIVRRPRVEWAVVLGLLFLFNGALSVNSLLVNLGLSSLTNGLTTGADFAFYLGDRATTYLIGYLALAYPFRPRWAADRPWALPVLFGGMMAVAALVPFTDFSLSALSGGDARPFLYQVVHDLFSVGFDLILLRWSVLVGRTTSPLELQQFRLLAGAFFLRAVHVILLFSTAYPVHFALFPGEWASASAANPFVWLTVLRGLVDLACVPFAIVLLLRHRKAAGSEMRSTVDFLIVMMAGGLVLYAVESSTGSLSEGFGVILSVLPQLDVVVVRPVFVTYAMTRYGLLGPVRNPRPLVRALILAFATFGLVPGIFGQLTGLGASAVTALLGALALSLAIAFLLAFLVTPYIVPPSAGADAVSVQTYVGLLEDAYRNGAVDLRQRAVLDTERRRLGVSHAQGTALEEAVRSRWANRAHTDWVAGDRILGRYVIQKLLGLGGYGEAHLAKDIVLGQEVVLKRTRRLGDVARRAFVQEAFALARLDHPHVVRLLRTERVGDEPVLVLEHLAGGSLATKLQKGKLPQAVALRVACEVLEGLGAAHAAGIVHRDVKPANVLFDGRGSAKLGDFGLARAALQPALGGATASAPGQSGSLRYQAPEVVRGLPATERSDLYSLAVVLHECLTGDHPVPPGLKDYETRQWIVEGPPILLSKRVPERVRAAVEKALSRDPAQRFASAAVFAATLRAELRARP